MRRVVITGKGAHTSLGKDWDSIIREINAGKTGIVYMKEWDRYQELNTRLAGPILDFDIPEHWSRKQTRSMGRVSKLAVSAAETALQDAGLLGDPSIQDGNMGVAYGSSMGSTDEIVTFGNAIQNIHGASINANAYIKIMSHTAAANISVYFGLKGRVVPSSSACTSGSQSIGFAYEAIKFGKQTMMVAGGADELCVSEAMVFDNLYATSQRNDTPHLSPRPYDVQRDGLVIGEGGGALILEELSHAQARGAKIYAEIVGFGTNSDGIHVTKPETLTMERAMSLALEDANLPPSAIGYVNGHGTATEKGDIAETQATSRLFGNQVAISSLKGFFGHTLGACGTIETWLTMEMMNRDWYLPTANLDQVDGRCGELDYLMHTGRKMQHEYVMSNNFAFGGINTSLVLKRWK
ncbi:3-oxoacyl-(Acyl-carrier-protein) synthase II [gamma proteobacterium HdN1]|nr:3-oxoacyl-(Acyl-carrier-protein) synthase II [gamma proteobacterium HdN1]